MLVNEIWRVGKAYFWTLNLGFNSVLVRVVSNFSSDSLQERKWVYFLKCQSLPLQFTWCAHVHLTTIVQWFPSSKFTSLSSSFSSTNVTNVLMLKGKNSVLPHFGALRKIIFLGCAHTERINQGAGESRNKSHVHWGAKGTGTHCFSEIKKKKMMKLRILPLDFYGWSIPTYMQMWPRWTSSVKKELLQSFLDNHLSSTTCSVSVFYTNPAFSSLALCWKVNFLIHWSKSLQGLICSL